MEKFLRTFQKTACAKTDIHFNAVLYEALSAMPSSLIRFPVLVTRMENSWALPPSHFAQDIPVKFCDIGIIL